MCRRVHSAAPGRAGRGWPDGRDGVSAREPGGSELGEGWDLGHPGNQLAL